MLRCSRFVPVLVFMSAMLIYGCKKEVPINSFVGSYHVTGNAIARYADTTYLVRYIDSTINVLSLGGNSLECMDIAFDYKAQSSYIFSFAGCCYDGSTITFHKPFDDSVFIYTYYSYNPAGGIVTTLRGKK